MQIITFLDLKRPLGVMEHKEYIEHEHKRKNVLHFELHLTIYIISYKMKLVIKDNEQTYTKEDLSIKEIYFGKNFDKSLDFMVFFPNVGVIEFDDKCKFNQSIDILGKCKELAFIHFGSKFNQPITSLEHCNDLETLEFGEDFNQPLDALKNHHMEMVMLPDTFTHSIDILEDNNVDIVWN
jgi:hypothetical protein